MKGSNGVKAFLVILVIAIMTYIAFAGVSIPTWDFEVKKITDMGSIRYGIDIKGGVRATLAAPEGVNPTDEQIESARQKIELRLDSKAIYDRSVTVDKVNKRIILEIPYSKEQSSEDPQSVIDDVGATALLTFKEVEVDSTTGAIKPKGEPIVSGDEVVDAIPEQGENGQAVVRLVFNDAGAKKFGEATARLVGQRIGIFLDEDNFSAPVVSQAITGKDSAVITLNNPDLKAGADEARELAATIKAGALPFKLDAIELNVITALLGTNALRVTAFGGMIAFILVWAFMLLYYRLPGIVANIALLGQIVAQLFIISIQGISLTLPGIAGIILTVGMSVDANVIIFERIREEMRSGKTVQAAIDIGFKRAFSSILDGNLTTLIAAVVLYIFGTGPIQSFALTLGLGVLINFITAIFVTKVILRAIAGPAAFKKSWLYGVKGGAGNV